MQGTFECSYVCTTSSFSTDYYDGPLEEETTNPEDVVNLDEEDVIEDEILKLYEDVVNARENGALSRRPQGMFVKNLLQINVAFVHVT